MEDFLRAEVRVCDSTLWKVEGVIRAGSQHGRLEAVASALEVKDGLFVDSELLAQVLREVMGVRWTCEHETVERACVANLRRDVGRAHMPVPVGHEELGTRQGLPWRIQPV